MGRVQQYSIQVQRQVTSSFVVDVGYIGTKGDDLYGTENLNQPVPGPGTVQTRRAFTQYTNVNLACPCFKSRYNGLEIRAEKRMSNGLQFLASYTWIFPPKTIHRVLAPVRRTPATSPRHMDRQAMTFRSTLR